MGKEPDEIREEIEETRDRMSDTVDAIAYKADVPKRMQEAVNNRVDSMKSTITGTVGTIRDRVAGAMPDTGDIQQAAMTTIDTARKNPLGVLFGSAAVGFLLGSLFPATDIENERLGEISDQLKETAQSTGEQILAQGKAVVRETIEAAKDAARESAIQHGQDVVQTAKQGLQGQQAGA